jgi:hypothetical protein
MAKVKASGSTPKRKRGRPAAGVKTMKTLGYRVGELYSEWLERVASANRSSVSGLIDQAVAKYAREIGVTDSPPDRTA